jgi:16S rRNA processing protein RimM
MTPYCCIGKLVTGFGLKGELILQHSLGKKTSLKGLEVIFIETSPDLILPYFLESARARNEQELTLKLEGVDTPEAARKLIQAKVWLDEEAFRRYSAKAAPFSLLGFHLVQRGEDLGEILEVTDQPQQLLCRFNYKGKEALVPLHEKTLLRIDKKKKQVHVQLPEGLLEIYS